MTYLGMEFKNYEELEEWSKKGHIERYVKLTKMFDRNPSMEINSIMCDLSQLLIKRYGLTPEEIEQLEIAAYKAG